MPGLAALLPTPGLTPVASGSVAWAGDLLNAAFFHRPARSRYVADLRLALGVLTTRWALVGRPLDLRDGVAVGAAFAPERWSPRRGGVGLLDADGLLAGGARLLGGWFAEAWDDPARRAHGIAFPTADERAAHDPTARMRAAPPGALTPPTAPDAERVVGTYEPVPLDDLDAALALLGAPERWPELGCAAGQLTALRRGGLAGQTFEIALRAGHVARLPAYVRAHVTCRELALGDAADASVAALEARLGVAARPAGGRAVAHVALTTHAGHPLGAAVSHLVVTQDAAGAAAIRDVGEWDPLPPLLAAAARAGGAAAQHAFWSPDGGDGSMLVQLARAVARG